MGDVGLVSVDAYRLFFTHTNPICMTIIIIVGRMLVCLFDVSIDVVICRTHVLEVRCLSWTWIVCLARCQPYVYVSCIGIDEGCNMLMGMMMLRSRRRRR